jgi:peroxiredoxin (alkyl hydroperoxide reductase subunit C)
MKVKVGDKLPDAKVFLLEKDPKEVSVKKIINGEKTILFGLPGAFTPTCSSQQLPAYEGLYDKFKDLGIDAVYCISVNDAFVMNAWARDLEIQ